MLSNIENDGIIRIEKINEFYKVNIGHLEQARTDFKNKNKN